jgi:hypothetical protein
MHYRNGREAKNGDTIVSLGMDNGKVQAVGILYNAIPGNDYCNGNIAPVQSVGAYTCMCDCLHIEDVEAALAVAALDKRPAGK